MLVSDIFWKYKSGRGILFEPIQRSPVDTFRQFPIYFPESGSITVKKSQDFKITGDGHSDNWKSTEWINVVQQGSDLSVYQTKVKVLYSETGIYFLFDCEDKKLTSTMKADYLNLYEEDVGEVFYGQMRVFLSILNMNFLRLITNCLLSYPITKELFWLATMAL